MAIFLPAQLTIFFKNLLKYTYKFFKWLLYPLFWTFNKKADYIRFGLKKTENRTLNVQERWFVEQIPVIHAATGIIIGFTVSIFTVANLYNYIKITITDTITFFQELFEDFSATMLQLWEDITTWFTDNALYLWLNIEDFFTILKDTFVIAFSINPYTTLLGLLIIGIALNVGYIIIHERLIWVFLRWLRYLFRTPDVVKIGIQRKYREINHKYMIFLITDDRLRTRNIKFFRRSVIYTFIMSIYALGASVTIALEPGFLETLNYTFLQILYVTSIVFIGELVTGSVFYPILVRLLDFLVKSDYTAEKNAVYEIEE
jgi:hypothetical protein